MSEEKVFSCKEALGLLLDQIDFERGACTFMDPVGACIPKGVLSICHAALEAESNPKSDNISSPKFSYDELVSKLENKHGARKWVVEKWYVVRKVYDIMAENFGR